MKKRIGVLSGGISGERYLSLRSGEHVLSSLRDDGDLELFAIDWEKPKRWVLRDRDMKVLLVKPDLFALLDAGEFDCVYDLFSGKEETDGHIAAIMDLSGIPYAGNNFYASFTGMDKQLTKLLCKEHKLPVLPDFLLLRKGDAIPSPLDGFPGFPLIVKPSLSGSSIGISLVKNRRELDACLELLSGSEYPLLLEKYVKGRELCSAVVFSPAHGKNLCPPVVEISYPGEIFDAECKRNGTYSSRVADIPREVVAELQAMAITLHDSIRANLYTRTDFILDDKGNIWILEINTHPGMGECSILPRQLAEMGIPFGEYIKSLIFHVMDRTESAS